MRGAAWALCTAHVATALLAPPSPAPKLTKRRAVLTVGTPLDWPDALDRLAYVREHGIDQFIEMWRRSQTLKRDDDLLWGDEVEYAVLRVEEHQAKISLRAVHKSYCRDAPTPATMACPWGSLTARFGQLGRVFKHPTHWLIYAQVTRPRDPRRPRDEGGGAFVSDRGLRLASGIWAVDGRRNSLETVRGLRRGPVSGRAEHAFEEETTPGGVG